MYKKIGILIIIIVVLVFGISMIIKNTSQSDVSFSPDREQDVSERSVVNEFTLEEVQMHNTSEDCYVAINNKVYDLGQWVDKHPGGERAIINICGTDGSAAFSAQHEGNETVTETLSGFSIGNLKTDE